ncbi:metal dependent phosphohydrolase [Solidesulfovibrio fructosivorans JJ]]|uniref:Metal dependent phosphohydrolase n=1 Tax=Solidesulfovibrio fructosivorans JJ] TaxID=596151 RepID=E1JZR7_SOLFR|nr:HDIG domain-containing metalloprotein [Solidesulfovibrio fructosivorans]EFL50202.1 metal dependent phosphohydrolase [Solidesulfovibrio fructosivorans JJ]]
MIDRPTAVECIAAQNPHPGLVAHGRETEVVMRAMAARLGEDPELWGITGLLHDLDYPQTAATPERHGLALAELLPEGALPPEAMHAIAAHNDEHTGVAPQTPFDFALRASESVTGIISAAALVRPDKMVGMKPKSIKKKMKDKAFAANVRRANILECEKAGVPLDEFLALAIAAIADVAAETGLA